MGLASQVQRGDHALLISYKKIAEIVYSVNEICII
ncbi:hypothetical protein MicvaDRAFT_4179 [Microcoleus vaginatus FGP-2]|nr:hypothetical protein MicvaDRAFT_4179 [Microcoleus vaginatus FGP-2]